MSNLLGTTGGWAISGYGLKEVHDITFPLQKYAIVGSLLSHNINETNQQSLVVVAIRQVIPQIILSYSDPEPLSD